MNILIVNGTVLPEPTGMKPDEMDITNSNRNITGKMKGQVIRHDVHTLEVSWKLLSADNYYKIAQAIRNKYGLTVFYHLPEQNQEGELTMYAGDRKKETYRYDSNGKPIYKNVSIKFVEE